MTDNQNENMQKNSCSEHFPGISIETAILAAQRLSRLRIFSAQQYKTMHPDVAEVDIDASWHAAVFGAYEGRPLFKREQIARVLGLLSKLDEKALSQSNLDSTKSHYENLFFDFSKKHPDADIFVSSMGNIFMNELAQDLAKDLQRAGVKVRIKDEKSSQAYRSKLSIFVAPHEFFTLGEGVNWMNDEVITNSFVWNTEQIQTQWFSRSIPAILPAKGVFDISPQAAQLFNNARIPSMHLEPGAELKNSWLTEKDSYHPLIRVLPNRARNIVYDPANWLSRPIDISFFGSESPRRELFFSKNAAFFAEYPSFIYYRRGSYGPIRARFDDKSLTRIAGHLSGVSKISLNVHRDEFSYFEWHIMVRQGMGSGSLVVTDYCLPHPHLKPGIHFFQDELKHLPNLIEWLLKDKEGQSRAQQVINQATQVLANSENGFIRTAQIVNFVDYCFEGVQ